MRAPLRIMLACLLLCAAARTQPVAEDLQATCLRDGSQRLQVDLRLVGGTGNVVFQFADDGESAWRTVPAAALSSGPTLASGRHRLLLDLPAFLPAGYLTAARLRASASAPWRRLPGRWLTGPRLAIDEALLTVDLDGDGDLDLLYAACPDGQDRCTVRAARQTGPLRFVDWPEIGCVYNGGRPLLAEDLDGDGLVDLVAPGSASRFVLLTGSGDGRWNAPRPFGGEGPVWNQLRFDVDGDGRRDLYFRTRNGDLPWQEAWIRLDPDDAMDCVFVDGGETWSCAADIDGDGDLDPLALQSIGEAWEVRCRENLGGSFGQVLALPAEGSGDLGEIAVGDLDGDGIAELVVGAPAWQFDGELHLLRRAGDAYSSTLLDEGYAQTSPRLLDLDGDGDLDLVTQRSGTPVRYLNPGAGIVPGSGQLQPLAHWGGNWSSWRFADLDGDGFPDLVIDDAYGTTARAARGAAAGLEALRSIDEATEGAKAFAVADFDGDGFPDLVASSRERDKLLRFHGPDWTAETPLAGGSFQRGLSRLLVADLNRDGRPDVIGLPENGDQLPKALCLASGDFAWGAIPLGATHRRLRAALADFDGDGVPDLMLASGEDEPRIDFFGGTGGGTFAAPRTVDTNTPPLAELVAADLDGDGWLDLVRAGAGFAPLSWMRNLGEGLFDQPYPLVQGEGPAALTVAVADVDGDGDPDVLAGFETEPALRQLLNMDGGVFGEPRALECGLERCDALRLADLNGDGLADATLAGDELLVIFATPSGLDGPARLVQANGGPVTDLRLGDVNGDGAPEILTLSADRRGLRVHDNLPGDGRDE